MSLTVARDAAALSELLFRSVPRQVRQEPALAVADGVTPLRLTVSPLVEQGELSSMLLSGASVVEVLPTDDGTWQLVVLPKDGACRVSLTLLQGNEITEFPLTVVPPPDGSVVDSLCHPSEFLAAASELSGSGGYAAQPAGSATALSP